MFEIRWGAGLVALLLAFPVMAGNPGSNASEDELFARINDLTISKSEFAAIFQAAVRHKYYHGKVMAAELEDFRKQVIDDIVTQELVFRQARERGLRPDRASIDAGLDAFELSNAGNRDWEERREKIIPRLIERLERQDLIEQMETLVRKLPKPEDRQIEAYYLGNPEKFTEPKRLWVSVIMRRVSPSGGESAWIEAETELALLKESVETAEQFAELAAGYSEHASAANGGDLGYLHLGVLEDKVQKAVEALDVDQVTAPLRLLEGVALFRLNGVQSDSLKVYAEVKERAAELLYQELQDAAWESYVDALRSSAYVYVND